MTEHNHNHDGPCCTNTAPSSLQQSMGEMEFERGIWSAACDGREDQVKRFMNQGIDVNAQDSSGLAALHYAARNGHVAVCQRLLGRGADVNLRTRSGGATALHRAAYRGQKEVVSVLLASRADVSLQDNDGQTALHKAAERGEKEVAIFLVSQNPDLVNIGDKRRRLPRDCLPAGNKDLADLLAST